MTGPDPEKLVIHPAVLLLERRYTACSTDSLRTGTGLGLASNTEHGQRDDSDEAQNRMTTAKGSPRMVLGISG